ncbi:MAG: hypothetical protein NTU51_08655 [Bacteroidetes bacterium]|nr:hypothetical protein [Bacteroidota bacterium]
MYPHHTRPKARFSIIFLLSWAFLFSSYSSFSQFNYSTGCQNAYQDILNLKFQDAQRHLTIERSSDPGNLIPLYLENYIDYLTLFISEDHSHYDKIKPAFMNRLDALEKGLDSSPYRDFCLGESNLQWAFVQMKFGEYTQAALRVRKANQYFTTNAKRFPEFIPNNIGLGITHFLAGLVPDSYKWIATIMGINGSVSQGLRELKSVANYSGSDVIYNQFKPQALLYMAMVSANLGKDKSEALKVVELFARNNGSSGPLIIFARASILMKNGKNEKALEILSQRPHDPGSFPFYFLDFMEGNARLNNLDTSALTNFTYFLGHFRGEHYIKSAWQKVGWLKFIKGDTNGYRQAMVKVIGSGNASGEEDKQAQREAESKQLPNLVMLRARLLFDGGYYEKAAAEFLNRPSKSYLFTRKDLVEYPYRLGRIYHESGSPDKALGYYRLAIQRGKNDPWYFAASAALQMGFIYENKGDLVRADSAYHVCLECRPAEYKASLSQKAKAGINRIKTDHP